MAPLNGTRQEEKRCLKGKVREQMSVVSYELEVEVSPEGDDGKDITLNTDVTPAATASWGYELISGEGSIQILKVATLQYKMLHYK